MRTFHLHLISDSTGETVSTIARAALAQFDGIDVVEHNWSLVRSRNQIEKLLAAIQEYRGIVLYTLVKPELEEVLQKRCRSISVPCVPVLDPVMGALSSFLTRAVQHRPGGQHELDEEYFQRIDAMQFVLGHDDGQSLHDIESADVILTGVSRTSKTPTCFYLANRGLKAANVPFIMSQPFPAEVLSAEKSLVVGLITSPERLVQVRRNRLRQMNEPGLESYVNLESVRDELNEARHFFASRNWPIIDVTRRSIEETAAAVLALYRNRALAESP
ncbi:MAG: putative pyruvate, phosphate dikinase regulatory protein [Alphaproteobacteria bacterium MarineAlpha9_Bin7]|nr:MAG: putative pyruvate, phosphate dikinase regulatory protein [Alphaproteobacteria bacterium MarineAlpha9_Bin7]